MKLDARKSFAEVFGFFEVSAYEKYLGFPVIIKKKREYELKLGC